MVGAVGLIVAFQNCAPYATELASSETTASSGSSGSGGAAEPPASTPSPQSPFESSRCANSRLDFCDDFENGTVSPKLELVGAPVVDSVQPRRGTKSLHITKTGSGNQGLRMRTIFPAVSNTYYGRAFMRFATLPKAPLGYLHYSIITAAGSR